MPKTPHLHAVYLESQDEITSVIDQIKSCPDAKIALVGTERSSLLQSLVNLKLLKHNSEQYQKELILISSDSIAVSLAEQIGMTTYPRLAAANQDLFGTVEENPPRPAGNPGTTRTAVPPVPKTTAPLTPTYAPSSESRQSVYTPRLDNDEPKTAVQTRNINLYNRPALVMIGFAALLPVLAIIYAAYAILPRAEIKIVPKTQSFSEEMDLKAASRFTEVNFFAKEIPLSYFEASETGQLGGKSTEKVEIGTKASGNITIFNKADSNQISLPAGTEVTSYEGRVFVIQNDTRVPGLVVKDGVTSTGVKTSVSIEAKEVGEEYNIDKTNFTVAGYGGNLLWGESYNTFTGGESHNATVLGLSDVDTLRTRLLTDLTARTEQRMASELSEGQAFAEGAVESQIVNEILSSPVGSEISDFTLTLSIRSQGLAFREADVLDVVGKSLSLDIPAEYEPLSNQKWDITYQIKQIDYEAKSLNLSATGQGQVAMRISTPQLKERLLGKNRLSAEQILELYEGDIETSDLSFWPFYVKSIPRKSERLTITKMTWDEYQAEHETK